MPSNRLNLSQISSLKNAYPQAVIGVSDHFSGISSGPVSYMLGARVFEKHVTFNRAAKGTDHAFSLLPEGFRKFVRDVHNTSAMLKEPQDHNLGEEPVFQKVGQKTNSLRRYKCRSPYFVKQFKLCDNRRSGYCCTR